MTTFPYFFTMVYFSYSVYSFLTLSCSLKSNYLAFFSYYLLLALLWDFYYFWFTLSYSAIFFSWNYLRLFFAPNIPWRYALLYSSSKTTAVCLCLPWWLWCFLFLFWEWFCCCLPIFWSRVESWNKNNYAIVMG